MAACVEAGVSEPIRGVIDAVLDERAGPTSVAGEACSRSTGLTSSFGGAARRPMPSHDPPATVRRGASRGS